MKDQYVQFRVVPEERKIVEAISRQERLNLSEAMRLVIREAAQRRGMWPPRETGQGGEYASAGA